MPKKERLCVSIKYPNQPEMSQANGPAAHALDGRVLPNTPVRHSGSFTAYAERPHEQPDPPRLRGLALLTHGLPVNIQLHWEPELNLTSAICSQLHNADTEQAPEQDLLRLSGTPYFFCP